MFRDKSNQPTFPGIVEPSIPFDDVRDGRRSTLFYYDVDLTTARSVSAGTPLILNLAGNSFYVDQDTANVGYATVHFQDTNLGISPAPIYVGPGFIANVPFTQLLIENTAQAGKRLRIFYGVDIDFQAGVNAQVSITGTLNAALTQNSIVPHSEYSASYKSITNMAANTPDTIFAPGVNTNGAIIWDASFTSPVTGQMSFIAKASAPASVIDGDIILGMDYAGGFTSVYWIAGKLRTPVKIAAGKGLYAICSVAELAVPPMSMRSCLYTLL